MKLSSVFDEVKKASPGGRWLLNAAREEGLRVETLGGKLSECEKSLDGWADLLYEDRSGRVGFASMPFGASGFDAAGLVERAKAVARIVEADEARSLPRSLEASPEVDLGICDQGFGGFESCNALELVLALEEAAGGPKVSGVRKPTFSGEKSNFGIYLSNGESREWSETSFGLKLEVTAREGDFAKTSWDDDFSRVFSALDPVACALRAKERALRLLNPQKAPTGSFSALIDNRVAAEFLEIVSESFFGDSHTKKLSLPGFKPGKRCMSKTVSIIDDGLYFGGVDTRPLDDEGSARRTTRVVEGGVLKALLYDRESAFRAGARTTGNGGGSPPGPSSTNLYIAPGIQAPGDITKGMERGLVILEVMGAHTADPVSGDFSLGASGLVIEGGEVCHSFVGATIAGNFTALFKNIAAVCADLRWTGSFGSPSLLAEPLEIIG